MKTIRISANEKWLVLYLMTLDVRFIFDDNAIYIFGTSNVEKFQGFLLRKGISQQQIDKVEMKVVEYEI